MPLLIQNATILAPTNSSVQVLRCHDLEIADGRVIRLAPHAPAPGARPGENQHDEIIDGRRYLVVPGLINVHHHLYQSLTRCLPAAQDKPLFTWLQTLYRHWRLIDDEGVRLAAQVSLGELLLSGCTTTSDHFYLFPPAQNLRVESVLEAAESLGIRLHLCRGSMTLGQRRGGLPPDELIESDEAALADCERVLAAYHDPRPHSLRRIDLAPCSPFNVTPELLRDTQILARERNALLHTHLAETREEERYCLERFGRRPVQYLADLEWLGPDVYLAHCVCLNDAEVALLGQTRTGVAHCPTSNLRLGSGIARLEDLLAAGARVGLGVDGASSNDGGNLLREMKLALLSARGRAADTQTAESRAHGEVPLLPAQQALRLATAGGAACLNRPELGHLQPGAAADFALFRTDELALAGAVAHDPVAALVLCDSRGPERVFVCGEEVVRDGRLTRADQGSLAERLNEYVCRVFS